FELHVGRQLRRDLRQLRLDGLDHRDRVRVGLALDLQRYRGTAIEPGQRSLFLGAILGPANVADADGRSVPSRDDEVVEFPRGRQPAHGPEGLLAQRGNDVAARHIRVLADNGLAHGRDGNLVSRQTIGIHPDADGAFKPAADFHLTNAQRPFQLPFDNLVGQLGQFALRTLAAQRDGHYRRAVAVEFRDDRRVRFARQLGNDRGDTSANIFSRDVDVTTQIELNDDEGV